MHDRNASIPPLFLSSMFICHRMAMQLPSLCRREERGRGREGAQQLQLWSTRVSTVRKSLSRYFSKYSIFFEIRICRHFVVRSCNSKNVIIKVFYIHMYVHMYSISFYDFQNITQHIQVLRTSATHKNITNLHTYI